MLSETLISQEYHTWYEYCVSLYFHPSKKAVVLWIRIQGFFSTDYDTTLTQPNKIRNSYQTIARYLEILML